MSNNQQPNSLVDAGMVLPFAQAFQAVGGDLTVAYQKSGLPKDGPDQPLIPTQNWYDFIQASADLLGDRHFAFKVGYETPFPDLPNLRILQVGGVTLGECISALVVDAKRLTNMARYSLLIEADTATLSQHRRFKPTTRPAQPDGFFVGFILRLAQQSVGVYWRGAEFWARVSDPGAIPTDYLPKQSISRTTGNVRFQFPAEWLMLGRGTNQTQLSQLGPAVHTDYVAMVTEIVDRDYSNPALKLENVSGYLSLPERTLQAKLAETGATFRTILIKKRISEACRLLTETDFSITEIGRSVGYWEMPSFTRAFQREMEVAPTRYREERIKN